jgi:DeoR/GlpR family transcriptional regulator of sugar metabolism
MLREERHNYILQQIALHKKVYCLELCKALGTSIDTVRRDLADLEKDGKLQKVHGGAISKSFHYPFQQPEVYARDKKKEIAKKALRLIRDEMTLLIGGGTIMLELARMFPQNLNVTIFTVSPLVALEIAQRSTAEVILLAGKLMPNSYICTGAAVIRQLSEVHVDLCLLGTNAISPKDGITDTDWDLMQVKKTMIGSSKKTAALALAEKLGSAQNLQVCNLHAIDYLITELDPADERVSKYGKTLKLV